MATAPLSFSRDPSTGGVYWRRLDTQGEFDHKMARLFAAAPRMAEALEDADQLIAERMSDIECGTADATSTLVELQNNIRAILAEIKGEV